MEGREYFIWFPIALLISLGIWIIPLYLVQVFSDAKKYKHQESEYRKDLIRALEEKADLEKDLKSQNDTINAYRDYTGIFPREIADKLEKRNNRKKRR